MSCIKTQAPPHPDLQVQHRAGVPRKPRLLNVFRNLSNEQRYGVYANNLSTLERAVLERVFYVRNKITGDFQSPPEPSLGLWDKSNEFTDKLLTHSYHAIPLDPQRFVDESQACRKKLYQKAVNDNLVYGVSARIAEVRAFVKREKYNFTKKSDPVPRVIQPRDARYIVETGRYIRPIEKKLYKNINEVVGHCAVFKGLNADQRAKELRGHWDCFKQPVAVMLDAERFDEHVSKEALEWEHSIYKSFYPRDKYFGWLMKLQTRNVCKGYTPEGVIKYRINRNRMSGDSNTALGNTLIMCMLLYTYLGSKNITGRIADDGDDSVIIMEQSDLPIFLNGLYEWFISYGFSMAVEPPVSTFEEIEFCQCHPVYDGVSWVMVRDPRVSIAKDCVVLKPMQNRKVLNKWMSAVGKGGLTLTGGIPVVQNLYHRFSQLSEGATELRDPTLQTGFFRMGIGMKRGYSTPTPEARCSFWKAFGITPECQIQIEQWFDAYTLDGAVEAQPHYCLHPML